MRIHRRSLEGGGEGSQARYLAHLAARDPEMEDVFTEAPDEADLILLTDAPAGPRLARALFFDPFLRRHRARLFLYAEDPKPWCVLPGVYTSLPAGRGPSRAVRAMGYPCWSGALNSFVDQEAERPPERSPDLLYSFAGRNSHRVRRRLFRAEHDPERTRVVDTTGSYDAWGGPEDERREMERAYVELALRSRFALCPRGWGTSTLRLYEMMALGVAPVLLGDDWVAPPGPDWGGFLLRIPEARAHRVGEILEGHADEWRDRGEAAWRASATTSALPGACGPWSAPWRSWFRCRRASGGRCCAGGPSPSPPWR